MPTYGPWVDADIQWDPSAVTSYADGNMVIAGYRLHKTSEVSWNDVQDQIDGGGGYIAEASAAWENGGTDFTGDSSSQWDYYYRQGWATITRDPDAETNIVVSPSTAPSNPAAIGVEWELGPLEEQRIAVEVTNTDGSVPSSEPIHLKMVTAPSLAAYDPGPMSRGSLGALTDATSATFGLSSTATLFAALDLADGGSRAVAVIDDYAETATRLPAPAPNGAVVRAMGVLSVAWEVGHRRRYRYVYDAAPRGYVAPARLSGRQDGYGPSSVRRLDTFPKSLQGGFRPGAPGSYY